MGFGSTFTVTAALGQALPPGHLAAMSAAQGEAAETAGKPYSALTAELRMTAVVLGIVAG
jgi:hypothetical protein